MPDDIRSNNESDTDAVVAKVTEKVLDRYREAVPKQVVVATARDVVLDLTRGAVIQDFVPVLAERRIRERLGHPR